MRLRLGAWDSPMDSAWDTGVLVWWIMVVIYSALVRSHQSTYEVWWRVTFSALYHI